MTRKRHNIPSELKGLRDLVGRKIGKLQVIEISHKTKNHRKYWKCLCDCGKEHIAGDANLKRGMILSCGCNHYKKGDKNPCYTGYKSISDKRWSGMKAGAKRRDIDFRITQEYVWNLLISQKQ